MLNSFTELPPGYIPCYKLVELLHTKASELEVSENSIHFIITIIIVIIKYN